MTLACRPAGTPSTPLAEPKSELPSDVDSEPSEELLRVVDPSHNSMYFIIVTELQPSTDADTSMATQAKTVAPARQSKDPLLDIVLGPLLGTGSSGRVYKGTWNGATVAVKVR